MKGSETLMDDGHCSPLNVVQKSYIIRIKPIHDRRIHITSLRLLY